jgi:hypothetical protein
MVMKKGLILLGALVVVASFTVASQAQGLSGIWPGRAPTMEASPCDPVCPLFDPPVFYVGWMESSTTTINFDATAGGGQRWLLSGLWLGLAERINLNCNAGVDLDGWLLIPSNRKGGESETINETIPVLTTTVTTDSAGVPHVTTTTTSVTTPTPFNRTWDTRPDWWYLDAAANFACCTGLKALAGFRYEHFSTNFKNPSPVFGLTTTPDDTADLTVNSYLPYVGLQSSIGGPGSKVSLRVIGFPIAPASVTFSETGLFGVNSRVQASGNWSRSHFMEVFAEGNRMFSSDMGVGAFFRWNLLYGKGSLATEILPAVGSIDDPKASFNRNTYTFGASFTLNLGSPF